SLMASYLPVVSYPSYSKHPTTTEIYTLSLHDALPISRIALGILNSKIAPKPETIVLQPKVIVRQSTQRRTRKIAAARERIRASRSEEHTSELQSPDHLVCRLLLEKKKETKTKQHRKM